jgi:hypothetical protein
MAMGECQLCGELRELRGSHIWSQFAYKRYAADQSKGGRFADLFRMRLSNEQYKESWFCDECEQRFGEGAAGILCANIDKKPNAIQPYNEDLLRFVTSISWRTLKFFYKKRSNKSIEGQWPGAKQWRRYLRGDAVGVQSYTQHVFLISNNPHGFDKMLGGIVIEQQGIVLSQIGPLLIAGLLTPERISLRDAIIWRNSQIVRTGASLTPLREWRTGYGDPKRQHITMRFAAILGLHQREVIKRVNTGNWGAQKRRRAT